MEKVIINARVSTSQSTGDKFAVLELVDGTSIVRSLSQFRADLRKSSLTMSAVEKAANEFLVLCSIHDLRGGTVSGDYQFMKSGSEFKADAEYIAGIARLTNKLRKVKQADGTILECEPKVGDTVVKRDDGYIFNSALAIYPNRYFMDNYSKNQQIAATMLQANGMPVLQTDDIAGE